MEIVERLKIDKAGLLVCPSGDGSNLFISKEDFCIEAIDINHFKSGSFVSINAHSNRVTGIRPCDSTTDGHILYTCSEDGNCFIFDLRKGTSPVQTYKSQKSVGLHSLDLGFSGNVLCCGTDLIQDKIEGDYGQLLFFDIRSKKQLAALNNVHSDIVTSVSFSKADNSKVLTSSMDSLCCITDITQDNDDDSLDSVLNMDDPIEKCSYFGPNDDFIWSISSSYTLSLTKVEDATTIGTHTGISGADIFKPIHCVYQETSSSQSLFAFGSSSTNSFFVSKVEANTTKVIAQIENVHETEINDIATTASLSMIYTIADDSLAVIKPV